MESTHLQSSDQLSWSALRRRADQLGIPAWRLAEELTYHSSNGALVVKGESNEGNELNSY